MLDPIVAQKNNICQSGTFAKNAIGLVFLFFSLWGFYLPGLGVRPLDILGLMALLCALVFLWIKKRVHFFASSRKILLSTAVAVLFVFGVIHGLIDNENAVKPAMGLMTGLLVFFCLIFLRIDKATVLRIVDRVIIFHVTLFFAIVIYYMISGNYLNIFALQGEQPRVHAGEVTRFAGAFMEPANYAFTVASLLMIKINCQRRFDGLFSIAMVSVIGSLSFWGSVAAILIVFSGAAIKRRKLLWIVPAMLLIFVASFDYLRDLSSESAPQSPFYRLFHFSEDVSGQQRYALFVSDEVDVLDNMEIWLGNGVGAEFDDLGMNGGFYLVSLFGIVGFLAFLLAIWLLARPNTPLFVVFCVLLSLTSAAVLTMYFWWMWLALLIKVGEKRWDCAARTPGLLSS